jgi:hypothetical protein
MKIYEMYIETPSLAWWINGMGGTLVFDSLPNGHDDADDTKV